MPSVHMGLSHTTGVRRFLVRAWPLFAGKDIENRVAGASAEVRGDGVP